MERNISVTLSMENPTSNGPDFKTTTTNREDDLSEISNLAHGLRGVKVSEYAPTPGNLESFGTSNLPRRSTNGKRDVVA